MLSKYDEEIEGAKKESFTLGKKIFVFNLFISW